MHVIDNKTCRKLLLWYEMVENITLANLKTMFPRNTYPDSYISILKVF